MSVIVYGGTVRAGLFPRSHLLAAVWGLVQNHRARLFASVSKNARTSNLGQGTFSEKVGTREHVTLSTARYAVGAPLAVQGAAIQP